MAIQHGNRGIVKKDLQLYYNRESFKSFLGEATSDISKPISIGPQGGSLTVATTYPPFSEDLSTGNYFKNVPTGGVFFHQVTNPALSDNVIYNNNGGLASSGGTPIPISGGTYLIFSFYVYLTQLYTGYNGALGGYINVNTNGGGNGSVGGVLTNYGWSFYVNGVLDNAWSNNSAYLNKWVRVVAIPNNGAISASAKYFTNWYIYNDRLTGGSMYIADFQIEQKTYATRPVSYDVLSNISNRGETTTNLISNPDFTSTSNWNANGTVTLSTSTNGAKTYLNVTCGQNGSTPGILSDAISVTAGNVYTLSAYASRSAGAEAYLYVLNVTANSDLIWTSQNAAALGTTEGWCVNKFTVPAGCTSIKVGILWSSPSIGNSFSVEKMQLEQREYQSAFVVGSRTANTIVGRGGLLDISGNGYNIDINGANVLFDSGGYYFNGNVAGPYIYPVSNSTLDSLSNNSHTYECWFKLLGTPAGLYDGYFFGRSGYHEGFTQIKSSPNVIYVVTWYQDNTNSALGATLSLNTWYHGVYVANVESNTTQLYINGVLTSNGILIKQLKQYTSAYYIGAASVEYASNSIVSTARAYNRALTVNEITQNFTATRKTYGI